MEDCKECENLTKVVPYDLKGHQILTKKLNGKEF